MTDEDTTLQIQVASEEDDTLSIEVSSNNALTPTTLKDRTIISWSNKTNYTTLSDLNNIAWDINGEDMSDTTLFSDMNLDDMGAYTLKAYYSSESFTGNDEDYTALGSCTIKIVGLDGSATSVFTDYTALEVTATITPTLTAPSSGWTYNLSFKEDNITYIDSLTSTNNTITFNVDSDSLTEKKRNTTYTPIVTVDIPSDYEITTLQGKTITLEQTSPYDPIKPSLASFDGWSSVKDYPAYSSGYSDGQYIYSGVYGATFFGLALSFNENWTITAVQSTTSTTRYHFGLIINDVSSSGYDTYSKAEMDITSFDFFGETISLLTDNTRYTLKITNTVNTAATETSDGIHSITYELYDANGELCGSASAEDESFGYNDPECYYAIRKWSYGNVILYDLEYSFPDSLIVMAMDSLDGWITLLEDSGQDSTLTTDGTYIIPGFDCASYYNYALDISKSWTITCKVEFSIGRSTSFGFRFIPTTVSSYEDYEDYYTEVGMHPYKYISGSLCVGTYTYIMTKDAGSQTITMNVYDDDEEIVCSTIPSTTLDSDYSTWYMCLPIPVNTSNEYVKIHSLRYDIE